MQARSQVKIRRLTVWFCINLIIFITCYLNYLLQLKHRYLYRILNVGLCLSRAAAMVINFNLLLVWLPMCKYSLTRLACLTSRSLKQQKEQYLNHQVVVAPCNHLHLVSSPAVSSDTQKCTLISRTELIRFVSKFKVAAQGAKLRIRLWIALIKLNSFNSFLVAVDHCKSLHTICATTITIASVIHTIAHLINVVNFSRNFDPLLNNLNMAEYQGQNPLQLLISVPGITGLLMMFILILMSLSSVDYIRNSCYDLFQIFHRLSVIFVVLLVLHPSSHVIKEQSNVNRHNPELCYSQILLNQSSFAHNTRQQSLSESSTSKLHGEIGEGNPAHFVEIRNLQLNQRAAPTYTAIVATTVAPSTSSGQWHYSSGRRGGVNASLSIDLSDSNNNNNIRRINSASKVIGFSAEKQQQQPLLTTHIYSRARLQGEHANRRHKRATSEEIGKGKLNRYDNGASSSSSSSDSCLDLNPLFVAQSSVCWFVLSIGLSCYVLDLLLRKLRRSKSSIELLHVRLDREDNLIELILSSNHKRFSHWLPGQFVYLNCPQIATYEWHPFTISSMDNGTTGQFTLHIKTSGDWTRKLRQRLESIQRNSMSLLSGAAGQRQTSVRSCYYAQQQVETSTGGQNNLSLCSPSLSIDKLQLELKMKNVTPFAPYHKKATTKHILPNLDCYNKMGQLQIQCKKLIRINHEQDDKTLTLNSPSCLGKESASATATLPEHDNHDNPRESYSITYPQDEQQESDLALDLFIDGPFHSPFERLLEQQVSVCIANGVGWTAFSSMFQAIISDLATYFLPSKEVKQCRQCKDLTFSTTSINSTKLSALALPTATTGHHQNTCNIHGAESLTSLSILPRKLSHTKLHLMVIVTSIEQLRSFYSLASDYFNQIQDKYQVQVGDDQQNPVKEITAFLTRSSKEDPAVKEFCCQQNLSIITEGTTAIVRVNKLFTIHFGKPRFDTYIKAFSVIYQHSSKISVYCCGSFQVKKEVRDVCQNLNRIARLNSKLTHQNYPSYSYHEENF